jgi:hypothetical protein
MNSKETWCFCAMVLCLTVSAQNLNQGRDSLYIHEIEDLKSPDKVLHAEPLYIDLIRDLGARKGEREWNVGLGLTDNLQFDAYEALVEYEWAPINRLGLEVELPISFYMPLQETSKDSLPVTQINSLKLAAQYTFYVSEKNATSMAIGYINELVLSSPNLWATQVVEGNVYNPFLVVAKRWGNNFHSLCYTGPKIKQDFSSLQWLRRWDINTSFHYMISGTRNFIGIELNHSIYSHSQELTIRPQMRLEVTRQLMIGIVGGIPIDRTGGRLSSFLRLIWEPQHR